MPTAAASAEAEPLRRYKTVKIRRIELDEQAVSDGAGLDYASKLDRRPAFLKELCTRGRSRADAFLRGWPNNVPHEI